jgi:hypothetical protein
MTTPTVLPDFSKMSVEDILRWVNQIRIDVANDKDIPTDVIKHAIAGARSVRERRAMESRSPAAKAQVKAAKPPAPTLDDL